MEEKVKNTGLTKEQADTLLTALEKEAGATFKDRDLAGRIIGMTTAMKQVETAGEIVASATHLIVNGNVNEGFKFYGPFDSEEDAFKFAENQFHLTKRWSIVELQKPV